VRVGQVTDLGFDALEGVFADVRFVPDGTTETAYVGSAFAGNGHGMWCPLRVGDLVVVVIPDGDPNSGPVVVCRVWNGRQRPHAAFKGAVDDADGPVPTMDFVLRTLAANKVVLQDGSQPFVRGTNYADALGTFLDAAKAVMLSTGTLATAVGTFATAVGVETIALAPAAATLVTAVGVFNTAVSTFGSACNTLKSARETYLSTRIGGE